MFSASSPSLNTSKTAKTKPSPATASLAQDAKPSPHAVSTALVAKPSTPPPKSPLAAIVIREASFSRASRTLPSPPPHLGYCTGFRGSLSPDIHHWLLSVFLDDDAGFFSDTQTSADLAARQRAKDENHKRHSATTNKN